MELATIEAAELIPFDYSLVDGETENFLKAKAYNIQEIARKAYTEIGKELKEARDRLSNNKNGCFEEWYKSLGYKRDNVSNLINRYEYILRNSEDKNIIEDLPLSLSYEVSKPSAPKELVDATLNGDITTHKAFQKAKAELEAKHKSELQQKELEVDNLKKCLELEEQRSETLSQSYDRLETVNKEHYKKLRDKERELEIAKENYETGATNNRSRINTLSKEIEELKSQEPKVVEKIVEVIPESTQERIRTLQQAKRDNEVELENLKREITKLSALKDKEETINDTYEKIKIVQEKNRNLMSDSRDIEAFLNWRKKTIDFFAQNTFPITTLNLNQATMKNLKEDIKPMLEIMEGFIYATKQKFKIEEE